MNALGEFTLSDLGRMNQKTVLLALAGPIEEYQSNRQRNKLEGLSLVDYVRTTLIDEGVVTHALPGAESQEILPASLVAALEDIDKG